MTFPDRHYNHAAAYAVDYFAEVARVLGEISPKALDSSASLLEAAYNEGRTVHVCGNGGAAAIALHFVCDHLKGIQTGTNMKPRVHCLNAETALMTAISNDISYKDVFSYQLEANGTRGDVLVAISASGASPNIVRVIETAQSRGIPSIAITGFDGGEAGALASVHVHVPADNYGIIEDAQQSIVQLLAQFIRQRQMTVTAISEAVF